MGEFEREPNQNMHISRDVGCVMSQRVYRLIILYLEVNFCVNVKRRVKVTNSHVNVITPHRKIMSRKPTYQLLMFLTCSASNKTKEGFLLANFVPVSKSRYPKPAVNSTRLVLNANRFLPMDRMSVINIVPKLCPIISH